MMTNCKDTSNSIIMDIDRLQLIELLAQKCDEWTRGESNSLPAEKAQVFLSFTALSSPLTKFIFLLTILYVREDL